MTTHRHSLSGKYTSYTNVPIPDVTTFATQVDLDALAARVAALEQPTGSVLAFSGTQADFLVACADMNYDVIEVQDGGTFTWDGAMIAADRSARPLTVRWKAGARFIGSGSPSYGILGFGNPQGVPAKYVTLDLTGCLFDGITLSMAGVFAVFGSDHCSIIGPTLANLQRGGNATMPYHAWAAYISAPYGTANDHLLLDRFTLNAPAVRRDVSAFQVASSGSHGAVTISNVSMDGYYYAGYFGRPISDLELATWAINDSGSVRLTAQPISGAYRGLAATASDKLVNESTGTFVDGGGNSGI